MIEPMIVGANHEDAWRLLTPLNIQVRRLWPWSFSVQKFIDAGEPRPRQSRQLLIASDYGGDHPSGTHHIYCFLVIRGGVKDWLRTIGATRLSCLPNGRTMSYKRLDDPQRQKALIPFLQAAAALDGHLVAIAVDKRKKWLATTQGSSNILKNSFELKSPWNPRALEAMLRKVQIAAALLSIWAEPFTNVTWITDQDEFVANEKRHDDVLLAAARMTSLYISHPMGIFRLNTTGQDTDLKDFEDLCSIPDLAAGMLSEISTRLSRESKWEDNLRRTLSGQMPLKTDIIANWFWDDQMLLRKTLITIDVEGTKYGVRKVWMLGSETSESISV